MSARYGILFQESYRTVPVGYVADKCPRCRDMRMFQLARYEARLSVFFIPTGWRTVSEYVSCAQCAQQMNVRAADYQAVEAAPSSDLPALAKRTNPGLSERLKREEKVSAGQTLIGDAARTAFIADAVRDASRSVGSVSWLWTIVFWFSAFLFSELFAISITMDLEARELTLPLMVAPMVAAGWCRRMVIRYLRREVLKSLAATLAPLQPDRKELVQAAKTKRWAEREVLKYGGASQVVKLIARASVAPPSVALGEK